MKDQDRTKEQLMADPAGPVELAQLRQRVAELEASETERKWVEEELAQEQYLLKTLMANVPDHIYLKDTDSRFIRINKALTRYFGLSDPAQAVGKTDFDFFAEEHAQQAYTDEQEVMRSGQPLVGMEERETWPDGRETWVSTTKVPLRDEEGRIIGTFGISRDITGRKRADEALAKERNLLRTLIDNLPDYIFVKDTESRFVINNIAHLRALGAMVQDEVVGKTDFDIFPQEMAEQYYAHEQKLIQSGQPLAEQEGPAVLPTTGERKWLLTTKVPLRDGHGKTVGLVGICRDITERKWAEEALIRSEERFLQVAENAQEWIWEVDAQGLYTYVSPAVQTILGYKPEEVVGKMHFYDLFHPEGREELRETAFAVFAQKQSFREFIIRNLRKDGSTVWLSTSGIPILDEERNLLGYRGVDADITEQKRMEEGLARERDLLRAIMDSIPDTIYFKDTDSRFVRINREQAQVLGVGAPEEAVGKRDSDFFPQELAARYYADEQELFRSGRPLIGREEPMIDRMGNRRWVSATKVPLRDSEGNIVGLVGISRDITEHKETEDRLRRTMGNLERFNRLAVGRELQMIELKREVNDLLRSMGREEKYRIPSVPQ